ncbi:MAG: prevent-host-death protein [Pseudomonadota bacterium]|nr:prevent-host-death protein [Pseudomonadota bacterium]
MIKTISATDAVRTFSDLLNAIKYRGESFTILRGGKPAATIGPVAGPSGGRTLKELSAFLATLPAIEEKDDFAADLEEIIGNQPALPEASSWE